MKANERDELLIRLDEKVNNIYSLTEKQEKHLRDLNSTVSKNATGIADHGYRLNTIETGVNLKFSKRQIAFGSGSMVTIIIALITAIGKSLGWW